MPLPVLATKLHVPVPRDGIVDRARVDARLDAALTRRLTLVSAPAGFGKTTAVAHWARRRGRRLAWLSLDSGDADPVRFLAHLIAACRTLAPSAGESVLPLFQLPQPPPPQLVLAALVNDLADDCASERPSSDLVLVFDDYHSVDSAAVDRAVAFLVDHLPAEVHLVIIGREDPALPIARLRASGQLAELRAHELRFTAEETRRFVNGFTGLQLSDQDVDTLRQATEGWVAGLQLAALSVDGDPHPGARIRAFSSSNRFVIDYLVEEVLARLPGELVRFLVRTSVLDRMCGPLCDAVLDGTETGSVPTGQERLEYLDRANLFVVPLDDERHWYRYHHLFRDLLRQRLGQAETREAIDALHCRAGEWLERNGFELEAFGHAAVAGDIASAHRLIRGQGVPLYARGALAPIAAWLDTLGEEILDAWPELRVVLATVWLASGRTAGVAELLDRAEASATAQAGCADSTAEPGIIGRIATIRAMLALTQHRGEQIVIECRRALDELPSGDVVGRATVIGTLGYGHEVLGERVEARAAYGESLRMSRAMANPFGELFAVMGIAGIDELDTDLRSAATGYERAIALAGGLPYPVVAEAHLGLGRIRYERNDLDLAQRSATLAADLARQLQNTDRELACRVLLGTVAWARGDTDAARDLLAENNTWLREHRDVRVLPRVLDALGVFSVRLDDLDGAARLAGQGELPVTSARLALARGEFGDARVALARMQHRAEARGWRDERLAALVVGAVAAQGEGAAGDALALLDRALTAASGQGYVRLFVDEGPVMARLLREVTGRRRPGALRLLRSFGRDASPSGALVDPLSEREIEVLRLLADGLSNRQIADRLYLSPLTVKVHLRTIYTKLGIGSRTQAVAMGRDLGLIAG